jgi:predicted ester cyclase/heme-degrading monooxygenase HmoA
MFRKIWIPLIIACITLTALLIYVAGCGQQKAENEKLKASVIRAVEDAWEKGELNALDKFIATDFIMHHPPFSDIKGLDAYKQVIVEFRRDNPDVKLTMNSMIMEGNTSASRYVEQFTDISTGKQVKFTGCSMLQWANGKIVECWLHGDYLGQFQQLGYKLTPPITKTTFARVTISRRKPEKISESIKIYNESLVPEAKKQKGFRGIMALNDFKTGKAISISIWDSEADAIANEQSGYYKAQVNKFKDFFTAKPISEGYTVTVQE